MAIKGKSDSHLSPRLSSFAAIDESQSSQRCNVPTLKAKDLNKAFRHLFICDSMNLLLYTAMQDCNDFGTSGKACSPYCIVSRTGSCSRTGLLCVMICCVSRPVTDAGFTSITDRETRAASRSHHSIHDSSRYTHGQDNEGGISLSSRSLYGWCTVFRPELVASPITLRYTCCPIELRLHPPQMFTSTFRTVARCYRLVLLVATSIPSPKSN